MFWFFIFSGKHQCYRRQSNTLMGTRQTTQAFVNWPGISAHIWAGDW